MEQTMIRRALMRHGCYTALLLLLYAVQEAPALTLFGARGIPVIGLFIAIAMLENELIGALYGLAAGILCDAASVQIFGVASSMFLVMGCTVGLLVMYLVNACPRSALLLTGAAALFYGLVCHFFLYGFWDYEGSGILLLTHTVPTVLLTAVWGLALFFLVRKIRDTAACIGA